MIRTSRVIPLIAQKKQVDGFVRLYKEIFGSAPYSENYSEEWILEKVWAYHLRHGTIVLAEDSHGQVVGFACAVRLASAPVDVQEFLKSSWMADLLPEELTPSRTWYMSELGVASTCDRHEVASKLIRDRLISASHAGMAHYVTRTDPHHSVSRHLYEQIGAQVIANEQDMTGTPQADVLGTQSTRRIYLFGRANEALSKVLPLGNSGNLDIR